MKFIHFFRLKTLAGAGAVVALLMYLAGCVTIPRPAGTNCWGWFQKAR